MASSCVDAAVASASTCGRALYLLLHGGRFDRVLDVSNGIPFFAPLFCGNPVVLLVHHVHERQWFSEFPSALAAIGWFLESRGVPWLYRDRPVIAVSPTTRDALVSLGLPYSQIQVVYNGMESPGNLPNRERDAHRVAYVGRIKRYKRLDQLVKTIDALRHEFPDVHLDIAGDGDARARLTATVERLHLSEHVTIHGYVDDATKAEILLSASVFATPSMHEGWGLSVIEANAYGCPAVAYRVPGLQVAILDGKTGLLADSDEAFTDAVGTLLRDEVLRQRMSETALQWAQRFDWEACARQTQEILSLGELEREPAAVLETNEVAAQYSTHR